MKKVTFQKKLISSYLLIMLFVFFTVFSILLATGLQANRNATLADLGAAAQLVSAQFGSVLENMRFVSSNILSHMEILDAMSMLATGKLTDSDEQEAYRTVQAALINYAVVSSIYRVTYFNEAGYIIQSEHYNLRYDRNTRLDKQVWEQMDWLETARQSFGRTILLPAQQQLFHTDPAETLMLARAVRSSRGVLGYLIVEVTLEDISGILNYDASDDMSLVITTSDGMLIYAGDTLPGKVTKQLPAGGDEWRRMGYLSASVRNSKLGTAVTMIVPETSVWRESLRMLAPNMVEGFIILAVAILAILLLSKRLTRPLTELSRQMEETDLNTLSGRTDRKVQHQYAEIESLYTSFENMQERLQILINREIVWKTLQAEQQLQLLQAQINPHFMYNTLNMIGIMGFESGNPQIVKACRDFSNLLRYSVSDRNSSVATIGSEMENIRNYLSLMQMRFRDTCSYQIEEDGNVSRVEIPRLSLQPLVENIFKHGYGGQTAKVGIEIRTSGDAEGWKIEIRDDGCGAEPEKLERIRSEIRQYVADNLDGQSRTDLASIGLKNTILRLRLYYGEGFGWEIGSENPGFSIVLRGSRKEKDAQ